MKKVKTILIFSLLGFIVGIGVGIKFEKATAKPTTVVEQNIRKIKGDGNKASQTTDIQEKNE